ncbi:MAG: TM2 domain-containing protein [Deltaproteobacteria bacterium]|jgi:hypothetical protein|nr:TM2 domain-containing protein [Deltaproteobacteria bacterium]
MNYCSNCAKMVSADALNCPDCGHPLPGPSSPKSKLVVGLLCVFLGSFGIHRFYVGKIGTGILMLLTFGGFGFWTLIDLVYCFCDSFTDSNGYKVRVS